jgi:Carboxypeptidase regulatory-like domain
MAGRILSSLLVAALTCATVFAQNTAQINGVTKDQSGAVLPGVEITATQANTGAKRSAVTDETGAFLLPNLPIGPYQLEAALPGFKTFKQTGILLQVSANPTINVVLEVGRVSDQIEVQADAALVETRSTGVGAVIDNQRVLELPLNGRQPVELIILSGAAIGGGAQATNRNYPTQSISVGGGLNNGLTYLLDGGTHNDPFNNLNLPLPFPDALQEFKVETSAVPAQYGQHSAGAINAVTKSGTNSFHGDLFEFVRNGVFNATSPWALKRDELKRNQFGGVLGGPIKQNKLFFFGGTQITYIRSLPTDQRSFIASPAMLAGDFTTVASTACRPTPLTLRGPFVANQINPSQFSAPALNMLKRLPTTTDPCGEIRYGRKIDSDEQVYVGKVDYTVNDKHSLFFRMQSAHLFQPTNYDGENLLTSSEADYRRRADSWVLGDTYLLGPSTVSSFHGTLLRTVNVKTFPDLFTLGDLGVKNIYYPQGLAKIPGVAVSPNGFSIHSDPGMPGNTNSTVGQLSEDLSLVRGRHQVGFGVNYILSHMNNKKSSPARPRAVFNADGTGLAMADFMIGRLSSYGQGNLNTFYYRQHYLGAYIQDTWTAASRLTLSGGLRWEPYQAPSNERGYYLYFDQAWFDQGVESSVYENAPAGFLFPGDPQLPKKVQHSIGPDHLLRFAPRLGLAWDVQGNGLMTVRAAYGLYTDYPHFYQYGGYSDQPPWGAEVTLDSPGPFEDPWQGYPGGNPFPFVLSKNTVFPRFGTFVTIPKDLQMPYINQWNLSIQRQVGSDWLFAANYLGSSVIHNLINSEGNPAVFLGTGSCTIPGPNGTANTYTTCSTTSNTQQRRKLYLQNPNQGVNIGNVVVADDGGTRTYDALLLSVQKRRAHGVTIQGNYTWSHCIEDSGLTPQFQNNGQQVSDRRRLNRSDCDQDRRHNANLSTVYETPRFGNNMLRRVASHWRLSGIVKLTSGAPLTITPGTDRALTATNDQRMNYAGGDVYHSDKNIDHWFNIAAFQLPALGTYGDLGRNNLLGPGRISIDMGATREFRLTEKQSVEFRVEAFNAPNHVNPGNPVTVFNSATFGKIQTGDDPRIMQLALKYVF